MNTGKEPDPLHYLS